MAFDFTPVPALEYIKRDFDYEALIDPILPKGGIGLIHGKGGHGKTQLTFTIAKAIADGEQLFRRYTCKSGEIMLIQLDMRENQFAERLGKLLPQMKRPELLQAFGHEKPINILEPEFAEPIAEVLARCQPALVIFDTLRKLHQLDENDNGTPSLVYGAIKEICGDASVLVLHHDRKAPTQAGSSSEEEAAESFRGARAWVDDCDLGLRLRKRSTEQIRLDWSKVRCEEQPSLLLRMNPETLLLEPREPRTAREWAMQLIAEGAGLDRKGLILEVAERAQVSRQAATKAVDALL